MARRNPTREKTAERPLDLSIVETAGENILERFREDLRDIGMDIELFENRMGTLMRTSFPKFASAFGKGEDLAPVDLEDTGGAYEVRVNLPGVTKDDLEVKFLDQTLEIAARAGSEKEEKGRNFVLRERSESGSHRTVSFPTPVAPEKAEARLEHGVLRLSIPKLRPVTELRVAIR